MTLEACYAALGGDYEEVLGRLHSPRLVQKFVLKFLGDASYDLLTNSLESGNQEEAFRAAHTIKGMCQNLGFTRLGDSSHRLTEVLRSGGTVDPALLQEVAADYQLTKEAIEAFQASLEA